MIAALIACAVVAMASTVTAIASYLRARRAVALTTRVLDCIEGIDEARLSQRLKRETAGDEFERFVVGVNAMLDRIERRVLAQKRFAADVAHEIRSPLTALRGEIEVCLRRDRTPEEYRRVLHGSLEEALRLGRLAENLMSLERAESGTLDLQRERLPLRELLVGVLRRSKVRADEKDVRLTLHGEDREIAVSGDPDWLARLFENLVDNAVQHTPRMGEVEVRLAREAGGAVVSVVDHGEGIAEAHLPHIFERFYRVDPARSRDRGGAGLGLAIARQIAGLHAARITVESQPGKGSTFTVRFARQRREQ